MPLILIALRFLRGIAFLNDSSKVLQMYLCQLGELLFIIVGRLYSIPRCLCFMGKDFIMPVVCGK